MPNSRLQEGLPITPTLLKTFPPVYQTNEAGYFKNITKTKSDFYTNVVMTTLKSNSSWSSTSRRKNKEIIHPVYQTNKAGWSNTSRRKNKEITRCSCGDICLIFVSRTSENSGRKDEDGGCGHFKWVDEEEEEFRAFKKQSNLQHSNIESVMLLKLIVGLLVSILVCLVVVVIKM
ncbi:unnamed protein product [Lactuca saligna]|uniref:Uncharacterized protein n=1 Tax=Lactuca saligna TaxID=75948 RepID=A0AA35YVM9_LACSI|nr:unnamed protein product [Lactuca saligna]